MHQRFAVQIDLEALPDDPASLQQMLREVVPELLAENEKLWLLIQRMLRHLQSCKLNGVEPLAYLTGVLQQIVSGRTTTRDLHTLLPWNWRPPSTTAA